MAQAGYTPIQLYVSTTASAVPSAGNLANGELAINITDGKLFYKDNGGVVQVLATKGAGTIGGSNTQVQYNSSGALAGSTNLTFDGTTLTANALTVSNAVTLSGGTANGVPYLNASKVLTSGSALTFDGTTFSLSSGAITSTDSAGNARSKFEVFTNGQTNNQVTLGQGFAAPTDNVAYLYNRANAAFVFGVNNSEQMRLTSTGLGIGTSSPDQKLAVNGRISISGSGYTVNSTNGLIGAYNGTMYLQMPSGNNLQIWKSTTDAVATFDQSGNLGLGVTPRSGWNSGFKAMEFSGGYGAISGQTAGAGVFGFSWGAYATGAGTWAYSTTGDIPNLFTMNSGLFKWYTAPSGTAGNAITFTQAMTLDASGNLSVGYTSPYNPSVGGTTRGTFGTNVNGRTNLVINNQSSGSSAIASLVLATYGRDWVIGTGSIANNSNALTFTSATTEVARIDSSGNLLVGTTTATNGTNTFYRAGGYCLTTQVNTTATPTYHIVFNNPNGAVGSISTGGTTTAYNTSSDYRLKENIVPMANALETVAKLKPVTYKWKADGSAGEGFIAHELAEVCPQAVTGEKDAVDAEGNPVYQGIDVSFLVGTLTAAIQELNAKVDAQAAEFDAYKAAHP